MRGFLLLLSAHGLIRIRIRTRASKNGGELRPVEMKRKRMPAGRGQGQVGEAERGKSDFLRRRDRQQMQNAECWQRKLNDGGKRYMRAAKSQSAQCSRSLDVGSFCETIAAHLARAAKRAAVFASADGNGSARVNRKNNVEESELVTGEACECEGASTESAGFPAGCGAQPSRMARKHRKLFRKCTCTTNCVASKLTPRVPLQKR